MAVSLPMQPLALIYFFFAVEQSFSVFLPVQPVAVVVCIAIGVVVGALALHLTVAYHSLIDFSIFVDVDALPVEIVVLPAAEVDITFRVSVDAFASPALVGSELAEIGSSIGIGDFNKFRDALKALDEFVFAEVIGPQNFVFDRLRHIPERHLSIYLSINSIKSYAHIKRTEFTPN